MDAGLLVRLNPLGGNQLNVRELLRLLHPLPSTPSDENSGPDDPPEDLRRSIVDDYDYDDDFIDDGDLIEEQPPHPLLSDNDPLDDDHDDDFVPPPTSESDEPTAPDQSRKDKIPNTQTVHYGFGRFFVNRGDIPSLTKLKPPPNPPTPVGNVHVEIPTLSHPSPPVKSTPTPANPAPTAKKPPSTTKPNPAPTPTHQPSAPVPDPSPPPPKKKPPSDTPSSSTAPKSKSSLPPAVLAEITKLATLCQTEFGDKKPKLQDSRIQQQLAVLFREALSAGVARLFSDIAKDKRIIHISGEMWSQLSRFLRAKRTTLEALGHALHWQGKENNAKRRVEQAEAAVDTVMEAQRTALMDVRSTTAATVQRGVQWTRAVDEVMFEWYSAKGELQAAKNQLGSRIRSVKKAFPGWVAALKGRSFGGFAVAEQELVDSVKRIEEERAVKERQKRELDRMERKRKKEEAAAAVAAKRQATASAKAAIAGPAKPSNVGGKAVSNGGAGKQGANGNGKALPNTAGKQGASKGAGNAAAAKQMGNAGAKTLAPGGGGKQSGNAAGKVVGNASGDKQESNGGGNAVAKVVKGAGVKGASSSNGGESASGNKNGVAAGKGATPKSNKTVSKNGGKVTPQRSVTQKAQKNGGKQAANAMGTGQKQGKLTSMIRKSAKEGSSTGKRMLSTKPSKSASTSGNIVGNGPKGGGGSGACSGKGTKANPGAGFKPAGYTRPVVAVRSSAGMKPPTNGSGAAQGAGIKAQKSSKNGGGKAVNATKGSGKNGGGKNGAGKGGTTQGKGAAKAGGIKTGGGKKAAGSKLGISKPTVIDCKGASDNVPSSKPSATKAAGGDNPNGTETQGDVVLPAACSGTPEDRTAAPGFPPSTMQPEDLKVKSGPPSKVARSSNAEAVSVARLILQEDVEPGLPVREVIELD